MNKVTCDVEGCTAETIVTSRFLGPGPHPPGWNVVITSRSIPEDEANELSKELLGNEEVAKLGPHTQRKLVHLARLTTITPDTVHCSRFNVCPACSAKLPNMKAEAVKAQAEDFSIGNPELE